MKKITDPSPPHTHTPKEKIYRPHHHHKKNIYQVDQDVTSIFLFFCS